MAAAVETLQTALTYGTVGRYDIEQRVDGNPSTNVKVDYRNRGTPVPIERFTAYGFSPGLLNAYAQTIQTYGARVTAKKSARHAAYGLGSPTGVLSDPTVTMYTQYDPLVILQNEAVFSDKVTKAGKSSRCTSSGSRRHRRTPTAAPASALTARPMAPGTATSPPASTSRRSRLSTAG